MRVDVSEIKLEAGSHQTFQLQISVDPVELAGQLIQFDRPFTGEAEIWNAGDRLLVRASLSGEALLPCSRCLTRFALPLETEFEEEFIEGQPGYKAAVEDDDEAEDESGRNVSYFTGDEIDLNDTLRDNILLELPMQPLCRDDCAGLCPSCGTNLNEGPCSCVEAKQVDSRFAALQQLLRKPDSNS
jgi:uncharacterized protein